MQTFKLGYQTICEFDGRPYFSKDRSRLCLGVCELFRLLLRISWRGCLDNGSTYGFGDISCFHSVRSFCKLDLHIHWRRVKLVMIPSGVSLKITKSSLGKDGFWRRFLINREYLLEWRRIKNYVCDSVICELFNI